VSAGEWHYMPFLLCLEIVIGMLAAAAGVTVTA